MAHARPRLVATLACLAFLATGSCGDHSAPSAQGGPGAGGPGAGGPGAGGPGGQRGGRATDVLAIRVAERPFANRVEARGTLKPREQVQLSVNAADRVTGVFFEDGQRVRRGATLVTLATDEERAQLDAASASLADAKRIFERNSRLSKDGAVAEKDLETSRALAESSAAQVRAVQARIRDRVLVAPFDGVLGFRQVSTGAYVSPGQVVATLIDDSEMRLEFGVPSSHVTELKPGVRVQATTTDLPGRVFDGVLTSVSNAVDPATLSVSVRATLPNRDRALKAGMFMSVNLVLQPRSSLSVPEIALTSEGPDTFVFVVQPGRPGGGPPGEGGARVAGAPGPGPQAQPKTAEAGPAGAAPNGKPAAPPMIAVKTKIGVGLRENGYVEVVSGLKPGQQVVTDGVLKVRPNQPVRVKPAPAMTGAGMGDERLAAGDAPADKAGLRQ